jgi:toxin ParE1/3/4
VRIERHSAVIENDLPEIYAFIARDDLAAAERVLDAVEATLERIGQQPESGVVYRTRNANLRGVRMIPVSGFANYLVFYRIGEVAVNVLYVVHGARHLPRFFRSESRS